MVGVVVGSLEVRISTSNGRGEGINRDETRRDEGDEGAASTVYGIVEEKGEGNGGGTER